MLRVFQTILKSSVRLVLGVYIRYNYTLGKRVQAYVLVYCPLGQGLSSIYRGGPLSYVLTKDTSVCMVVL
jgi:hypothetical protein